MISNNQVENAIRPFVVERKGRLFFDTPQGALAIAIVYSLMETAKANRLNPEKYVLRLFTVLPDRLAADSTRTICYRGRQRWGNSHYRHAGLLSGYKCST